MVKNIEFWMGRVLTCRCCGYFRVIDDSWLGSEEVRRALDKLARLSHGTPRCSQCGARGWENLFFESAPPDHQDVDWYAEGCDPTEEESGPSSWREDDTAWEEHMEWLVAYERETEGPEAYGRGPVRFTT